MPDIIFVPVQEHRLDELLGFARSGSCDAGPWCRTHHWAFDRGAWAICRTDEDLHPETHFRPTKSPPEARVLEALKKRLPAGWSA
jgi:hypothetical protein